MENLVLEKENNFKVETTLQKQKSWIEEDVLVIILLNKNLELPQKAPYDIELCGKKMWEWVSLSVGECEIKTTVCTNESNILTLIKPYLNNKKYTAVLFSDTPLLCGATFNDIIHYVRAKNINVLNLERGYVFNTEYIKNADSLMTGASASFGNKYDFFVVDTNEKLYEAKQKIKNRILDFHLSNGVMLEDKQTIHIDADVIIESGTTIKQNNSILGLTYIGKNCTLDPNNIIKSCIISDNCIIKNSYLEESRISENMIVGPFESVINKSN